MEMAKIYQKYEIMPHLQEHMLRVAGIGSLVAQAWAGGVDSDLVIRTCLLHDMGNILKFDLSHDSADRFGYQFSQKWLDVQKDFHNKYGKNSTEATNQICRELDQDDVVEVLDAEHAIFDGEHERIISAPPEVQILLYADLRVVPDGVVSLQERINDLLDRYQRLDRKSMSYLSDTEELFQSKTPSLDIKSISEQDVERQFEKLLSVTI